MALLPSNLSFSRQILPVIAVIGVLIAAWYIVSGLPDRETSERAEEPPKAVGEPTPSPPGSRKPPSGTPSASPER